MAKKKKAEPIVDQYPKSIETFRQVGDWELNSMKKSEPNCFNSKVDIFKYRVTIEKIEEPKEVYQERLQKLWEETDNHHHYDPIKIVALKLGVELTGDFGAKRIRKH